MTTRKTRATVAVTALALAFIIGFGILGYCIGVEGLIGWPAFFAVAGIAAALVVAVGVFIALGIAAAVWIEAGS